MGDFRVSSARMMKVDLVLALTPCFCHLQKRSQLVKKLNDSDHQSSTSPLMEGTPTIKSKKKLLQIIDTTLLKCYLHVSCVRMPVPWRDLCRRLPLVTVRFWRKETSSPLHDAFVIRG